jgi:hypothetical protein
VRDRMLAHGLVAEAELSELMEDLKRHLNDPGTLVVSHLFFQVCGRKPRPLLAAGKMTRKRLKRTVPMQ